MKMNLYTKLYIGTGLLYVTLILAAATSAYAVTAESIFPDNIDGMVFDGKYARKGTIGATLINVLTLDKLLTSKGSIKEIRTILTDQRGLGSALNSLGFLE